MSEVDSQSRPLPEEDITVIYRNLSILFHPIMDEPGENDEPRLSHYRREVCKSVNAAKRRSRELQKAGGVVRRGKPRPEVRVDG